MRFRAEITTAAQDRLHKDFLPALEKMAKTAQVVLTPDQVMFVQTPEDGTDGGLVKLEFPTDQIFTDAEITSNKNNTIAFTVNVSLMLKAFAAAATIEAETMHVVLALVEVRREDGSNAQDARGKPVKQPVLRFTSVGVVHHSVQELPVSRPFTPSQIDELQGTLSHLSLLDWYVDVRGHTAHVEALLAAFGRHCKFTRILATRAGSLHVQIETDSVTQGLEATPLAVLPQSARIDAAPPAARTPAERYTAAVASPGEDAARGEVQTKGLQRALAAATLARPDRLLCACGPSSRPVIHLLCVFTDEAGEISADFAVHIWLPMRDDGDD